MLGFIITGFEAQLMEEVIDHHMETRKLLLQGGSQNRLQQNHCCLVACGTATHICSIIQSMLNSFLSPLKKSNIVVGTMMNYKLQK